MIKSIKPLSMAEVKEIVSKVDENEKTKAVSLYIKKFTKLTATEAEKIREEFMKLGNAKLKDENIAKIIDILPKDIDDIRKILVDVDLDQNEIAQILAIVKKYT